MICVTPAALRPPSQASDSHTYRKARKVHGGPGERGPNSSWEEEQRERERERGLWESRGMAPMRKKKLKTKNGNSFSSVRRQVYSEMYNRIW